MKTIEPTITGHKIVSREEWIAARRELLAKEKAATRLRDELSAERRKLPWVKIEKNYLDEVIQVASRLQGARIGCIEVRPVREIAELP